MVRMLRRFLFVPHFLALYVDDGLSFLPFEVAPLMALWQLCFMTALGVPLSLHKLQLGDDLSWIGWLFSCPFACVRLPAPKQEAALLKLLPLLRVRAKMARKDVEAVMVS